MSTFARLFASTAFFLVAPQIVAVARREYTGCAREVVFPSLGIRRELPPNRPVVIELPATLAPGEYEFKCGMNMIRGTLVVVAPGG